MSLFKRGRRSKQRKPIGYFGEPWFAWYPVPTRTGWTWLHTVNRHDGSVLGRNGYRSIIYREFQ